MTSWKSASSRPDTRCTASAEPGSPPAQRRLTNSSFPKILSYKFPLSISPPTSNTPHQTSNSIYCLVVYLSPILPPPYQLCQPFNNWARFYYWLTPPHPPNPP